MAKKPGTNTKNEFVFFNVLYEDGSQRSNRRVPTDLAGAFDKEETAAREFLIEQDREIAEKSGRSPLTIKTVTRVGIDPDKADKAAKFAAAREKEKAR